jgi:tRNA A37 N6-isopentenylltransferase MiaA
MEEHQKLSTFGFKKKNMNWRQHHQAYVDRWDELPPRDPDEEEWNSEEYRRYRRWFEVYGAASAPLESSDLVPPIPSAAEIPDVGYIPHVPHKQRTIC